MSNIYEPLLWYDASSAPSKFLPGLATSYSRSSDGLTWEFVLRKGVTFHDGRVFDSEAVKFVVERNKTISNQELEIRDYQKKAARKAKRKNVKEATE